MCIYIRQSRNELFLSVRDRTYLLPFGGIYFLCCRIVRLSVTERPLALQLAMASEGRYAPVSIRSSFTGHRTSNLRQVRRADVAHPNRTGWARFGEAHF